MDLVKMGKEWIIKTREDYDNALKILEGNEFCAMMSDDFYYYEREMKEVAKQRANVTAQAKALGIA